MTAIDDDIKSNLKEGFIWNIVNRFGTVGLQFISIMILSRLLSKEDFALMGIISFFMAIANLLIDSGMGGSLVGASNVNSKDYSTLFVYNFVMSIGMCLLLILLSGVIANFYEIESLSTILQVIGISIVLSSLGKIQNVILMRELKFKIIGKISLISSLISCVISICLAFLGYGIWALVIQSITFNISTFIFQFLYNRFIPKFEFSFESFKEQWKFGSHLFFSLLLQTVYNNIFMLIFPKISSLSFSGLYSQANKLQQLPLGIFAAVLDGASFPILSKIKDPELFKKVSREIIHKFYFITFFLILLLSLLSRPVVVVVLGNKWVDSSPILSMLCLAGINLMTMAVSRNILKSSYNTKKISILEVYKTLIGFIVLFISVFFGDYGILKGIVVTSFISSLFTMYIIQKETNYKLKEQLLDILSPMLILLPSYAMSFIIINYIKDIQPILLLLLGVIFFTTFTVLTGLICKNNEVVFGLRMLIHKVRINSKN